MPDNNFESRKQFKELLAYAIKEREEGNYEVAVDCIDRILSETYDSSQALLVKASLLFTLEDYRGAEPLFSQLVQSHPTSEKVSFGLFMSAALMEDFTKSVVEMERFLSLKESDIYYIDACKDYRKQFRWFFKRQGPMDYPNVRRYVAMAAEEMTRIATICILVQAEFLELGASVALTGLHGYAVWMAIWDASYEPTIRGTSYRRFVVKITA